MKIFYTLSVAMVISAVLQAQPTLTASNTNPVIGDTIISYSADTTGVSPGSQGANQTWDFSNIAVDIVPNILSYVSPDSTPYGSSYPLANIAAVVGPGTYAYYKTSASDIRGKGVADSYVTMVYDPNDQIVYTYPFTYNSNVQDTYASYYYHNYYGDWVTRNGSVSVSGDGYGTI